MNKFVHIREELRNKNTIKSWNIALEIKFKVNVYCKYKRCEYIYCWSFCHGDISQQARQLGIDRKIDKLLSWKLTLKIRACLKLWLLTLSKHINAKCQVSETLVSNYSKCLFKKGLFSCKILNISQRDANETTGHQNRQNKLSLPQKENIWKKI